jgi:hypothetical protein
MCEQSANTAGFPAVFCFLLTGCQLAVLPAGCRLTVWGPSRAVFAWAGKESLWKATVWGRMFPSRGDPSWLATS